MSKTRPHTPATWTPAARRAALVRYRPADARKRGHVESFFLKANDPAGGRAFWIKLTILAPIGGGRTTASVWAIAFDGATGRHVARKAVYPIGAADLGREQVGFRVGGTVLEEGLTRGELAGDVAWDLAFESHASPLRMFPYERLYRWPVPRSKTMTPCPDARFTGRFTVAGETWDVCDWPGTLGHNWGTEHAHRYAWGHVNAFEGAPGTWFEGLSAKVRVGPVTAPYLTLCFLHHEGRDYDFTGLRHWLNREVDVDLYRWRFTCRSKEACLEGELTAEPRDLVGLTYEDPDGQVAHCLNSKLAHARLRLLTPAGKEIATLTSEGRAALELLWRDRDHGIPIYC